MDATESNNMTIAALVLAVISMAIAIIAIIGVFWLTKQFLHMDRRLRELMGETMVETGRKYFPRRRKKLKKAITLTDLNRLSGYESGPESVIFEDHVMVMSNERRVSLHGKSKFLCQVYRTAQSFFTDETTQTDRDRKEPAVEDIMIEAYAQTGDDSQKTINSRRYSHKSRLRDDEDDCRKQMIVTKSVDASGGQLDISGVSLTIPSGALSEKTTISIGLSWNSLKRPNLSDLQAMLSPIIVCQPRDIVFAKPVLLSFPHCAINAKIDWTVNLRKSNNLTSTPDWEPLTLEDYEERDVTDSRVSLLTSDLYSMYCCTGESKTGKVASKSMSLIAYSSIVSEDRVMIKAYCVNDYSKCTTSAVNGSISEEVSQSPQYLEVHGDGEQLSVSVSSHEQGQEQQQEESSINVKTLVFSEAWHDSGPWCEFKVTAPSCDIRLYQEKHDEFVHSLPIHPLTIGSTDSSNRGTVSTLGE